MTTKPEFDFTQLDPEDGYRIEVVDLPGELSLHLAAQYRGEIVNPCTIGPTPDDAVVELIKYTDPTSADRGACDRLQQCLSSVARFLTTGGRWEELLPCLQHMHKLALNGLSYPGWNYLAGHAIYDPDLDTIAYMHRFVAAEEDGDFTPLVVWVEGVFVDIKTLGQAFREIAEDEEATFYPDRHKLSGGGAGQLELPDRADSESEEFLNGDPPG